MWFDNLQRAYKARDYINNLFAKRGIMAPVVSVHRTMAGFKVSEIVREHGGTYDKRPPEHRHH